MVIKNLNKAADRIKKAIKNKEGIILYGDSDLDGVTSVIILKECINSLGGSIVDIYFPCREKEGYGLNRDALIYLKKFSPALLLVLDCGISNFEEVKLAKKIGFKVIIVDHHEVLKKLPAADIIVDPKQKGDNYPFKELATVGIAYKLAEAILENKLSESLRKNFLELASLATLADMMPEVEENKVIIDEGLLLLKETFRPGLKVFFEREEIKKSNSLIEAAQKIISVLNIVEPKDHLNATYLLLTSSSFDEARVLVDELFEKRKQKQEQIQQIFEEIKTRISQKQEAIVFEGSYSWPLSVLGAVASKICRTYQKPVFLFKKKERESRGTVRTPPGINSVAIMKKFSKYLLSYGGHPPAAGFTIKNDNLTKFKEFLLNQIQNNN